MNSTIEFRKLLFASLVSQAGSHFLTLSIASFILLETHSIVKASLVFSFSFLPSVFVSAKLGAWVDRSISRKLLIFNDVLAAVLSAVCGIVLYFHAPLWVLFFALTLRSILMFIGRSAFSKWIKEITQPELQTSRIKLYFLTFFLSTAISGCMASWVLSERKILTVIILDIATYLIGILIMLKLKPLNIQVPNSKKTLLPITFQASLREIFTSPDLKNSFLLVIFSQAIFQGGYSVLVSFLPVFHLQIGIGGVGYFQFAASLGIIIAFVFNWIKPVFFLKTRVLSVTVMLTIICLTTLSSINKLPASLVYFFLLNFGYEVVWLSSSATFFQSTPQSKTAQFQFVLTSCASFLMAGLTLGYSLAIERLGLQRGVTAILFAAIVFILLFLILYRSLFKPIVSETETV